MRNNLDNKILTNSNKTAFEANWSENASIEGQKMNLQTKDKSSVMVKTAEQQQSLTLSSTGVVGQFHPLHEFYESNQGATTTSKLTISLVNAILKHRLIFFAVTKNQAVTIAEQDINWKLNSRFKLFDAHEALEHLVKSGTVEVFVLGDEYIPTLYAVSCPDLLNEINQIESEVIDNQAIALDWLNQNYK